MSDPEQRGEQAWVDEALEQNLAVVAARLGVEIAKRDVKIAQSGHLPTLDLFATTGEFDEDATETVTNRTLDTRTRGPADSDGTEDVVGLQVAVPIFTGGVTSSRVREQVYLHRASRQRLQGTPARRRTLDPRRLPDGAGGQGARRGAAAGRQARARRQCARRSAAWRSASAPTSTC